MTVQLYSRCDWWCILTVDTTDAVAHMLLIPIQLTILQHIPSCCDNICALLLSRSNVHSWAGFRSHATCMVQVSGSLSAISQYFYSCKKGACGPRGRCTCVFGVFFCRYELLLLSFVDNNKCQIDKFKSDSSECVIFKVCVYALNLFSTFSEMLSKMNKKLSYP